jgi:hypothetical protein
MEIALISDEQVRTRSLLDERMMLPKQYVQDAVSVEPRARLPWVSDSNLRDCQY